MPQENALSNNQDNIIDDSDESNEMFEHFRYVVDKGQSLLRIDKFLVNRIDNNISRSKIQEAADAGCILVNNKPVKSNYKIKSNDVISILLSYPRRETEIIPENIPLNIVFEDNELIVINKPPGLVVHPGHGNYTGTLVNALAWYFKDEPWFDLTDPRPGLVHRIDKDTSGLIVIAKTDNAKINIATQFYEKTSKRTYQALVWGNIEQETGTISGNIGRNDKDRVQRTVFKDNEHGKHAVTHFKVLERLGYITLVECKLETGRTHQIRVHFKHIGHPIFNDELYGGNFILKGTTFTKYKQFVENCFNILPRQALHAKTLGFTHPSTGVMMEFDSDLPDDMMQVIEKWRKYIVGRN
jgi:23S rRNA pseudouridine1911/1915/1917 synthase